MAVICHRTWIEYPLSIFKIKITIKGEKAVRKNGQQSTFNGNSTLPLSFEVDKKYNPLLTSPRGSGINTSQSSCLIPILYIWLSCHKLKYGPINLTQFLFQPMNICTDQTIDENLVVQ